MQSQANELGNTGAIDQAAAERQMNILSMLLERISGNDRNKQLGVALDLALEKHRVDIALLLIGKGADPLIAFDSYVEFKNAMGSTINKVDGLDDIEVRYRRKGIRRKLF